MNADKLEWVEVRVWGLSVLRVKVAEEVPGVRVNKQLLCLSEGWCCTFIDVVYCRPKKGLAVADLGAIMNENEGI